MIHRCSAFGGVTGLITKRLFLLALMLSWGSLSCTLPMSSECSEFFSLPLDAGEQVFASYPLDKQLVLYRCGMSRRPPARYLSPYIADKGEAAIPSLINKLNIEKDESFQYALIDVLEVMSIKGHLRGKPEVIEQIRSAVERMKLSSVKERARESLRTIEENNHEMDQSK